jgi:hypothetical protein
MPKFKTNRDVLDRPKPIELVLELLSFSGGENTIGEDVALKNNEARIIENWDALSIGGMIRSKGFNEVAAVTNVDSYDKCLIHFDGVDTAAAAVETVAGKVITFVGTAQLDTAQKKFGLSSLLLDGDSDYITLPDSADWCFGTGDFTIDFWIRPHAYVANTNYGLIGQIVDADNFWQLSIANANPINKLNFYVKSGGVVKANYTYVWDASVDTWYHIELARNGTTMSLLINGTSVTLTETTAIGSYSLDDFAAVLKIGIDAGGNYFNGWIDEVRIGKGIARHTANFTAPTLAYVTNGQFDLLIHHKESTTTQLFGIIKGDLVYKDSTAIKLADASGFTSGQLSYAVSAGDKLWITNSLDNLKYKTIAGVLTTPTSQPGAARERIHYHQFRLIAEGGGKTVYGSRAASGNWTAADAWSLANDAWNIDMPDYTYGGVSGFPSGAYFTIFTYFKAYLLSNFPDVKYDAIPSSHGCCAPLSIAKGDEGIYFLSNFPTLGVFLWDGVNWINLTENHDFVDDINLAKRIYGFYRDGKYFINYCESGSTVSYPNRQKIYDASLGRWMTRPINTALSENFGYPALLKYDNNELYNASSVNGRIYELETEDNSDEGENTEANYLTKDFNSSDFGLSKGDRFPISNVRLKLIKMILTYYGNTGNIAVKWNMDKGRQIGQQTITMTTEQVGAKINEDFTVNTSYIIAAPNLPDKTVVRSFKNSAVGRWVNFQILNNATGERPKIKSLKIHAMALEEL